MKKVYEKPVVIFEDFSLSANVAGTCEVDVELPSQFQCGVEMLPTTNVIFLSDMSICNTYEEEYLGGCYDVPTDDRNLFNS